MVLENSIYSVFFEMVRKHPEKVFIYHNDKQFTYAESQTLVLRYAALFHQTGIRSHDRIALMLPNGAEFIFSYLALSRLQAAVIPVHIQYKSLALRHIISNSQASGIIFSGALLDQVKSATEILDRCNLLISDQRHEGEATHSLESAAEMNPYGGPFDPANDDTSVIFYSQGTVFSSRGVIYTNQKLMENARYFIRYMSAKDNDILAVQYPFTYPVTFTFALNSAISLGATLNLLSQDERENINWHAATVFIASPWYLMNWVQQKNAPAVTDSLHYCVTGGSRLKKEVVDFFVNQYRLPVFQAYSLVETGPVISLNIDEFYPMAIGIPLNDYRLSIRRENSQCGSKQIGEICIAAAGMQTHFVNENDSVDAYIKNGWYSTGDLGYQDVNGHIFYVDRVQNQINVNGFDVYPEFIEQELNHYPGIREATVIGIPQNSHSEKIQANIVTESGNPLNVSELQQFLSTRLPRYQIPQEVVFMDHLPRNITGKITRQTLKNSAMIRGIKLEEQNERVQN